MTPILEMRQNSSFSPAAEGGRRPGPWSWAYDEQNSVPRVFWINRRVFEYAVFFESVSCQSETLLANPEKHLSLHLNGGLT